MGGGKVTSSRRSHQPAASADWSARAGWQVELGGLPLPGHQLEGDFWRKREREKIKKGKSTWKEDEDESE